MKDSELFRDDPPWWRRIWRVPRRWWTRILIALLAFVILYYLVGALVVSKVDDDIVFVPPPTVINGAGEVPSSRTVDMIVGLLERELSVNGWTANDPFFLPGAIIDNMPNFQMGMVGALSRVVVDMGDQLGRTRGSSSIDPDLDKAAGLLKYPGNVWLFNPAVSWAPTASSETQYRAAAAALRNYNLRLSEGKASFEKRTDNLRAVLDRISKDLGSLSGALEEKINERPWLLLDTTSDDVFYTVHGRMYAYYMVLRALGEDFAPLLAERGMTVAWNQLLFSMEEGVNVQPWIVVNAAPDAFLLPSHLATKGFYLMRTRIQLGELSDILLK